MGRKHDIRQEDFLPWDQFDGKPANIALPAIYAAALGYSKSSRDWYWNSIHNKRRISAVCRFLTFALGAFGVVAPLLAAVWSKEEHKLLWSQLAVISLAIAGLLQLADRVFGWSSGWLRYGSTVTAMENLTRQFQLEWAVHFVDLPGGSASCEVRPMFDLARRFQTQIGELQASETDGWIVEFNAGRAMLSDHIKSAREAAEKSALDAKAATLALSKARECGAIELTVTTERQPRPTLTVSLDGAAHEPCTGLSWVQLQVDPGIHRLSLRASHEGEVIAEATRIVEVLPGAPARLTIAL